MTFSHQLFTNHVTKLTRREINSYYFLADWLNRVIYSVSDMVKSSKKLNNALFFAAKKSNITAVVSNFFVLLFLLLF